jgi:hypothetical protein
MRERWTAEETALRQAAFPIVGLRPPFPGQAILGAVETVNDEVTKVGLRYGSPQLPTDPLVTVYTALASSESGSQPDDDVLEELLREHDADAADLPVARSAPRNTELLLDGVRERAHILDIGPVWAALARPSIDGVALVVTVAARGQPLAGLALAKVEDLDPYLAARRERVEAALARAASRPGPESWDLPPARGLAGHQALAGMMISIAQQGMAPGDRSHRSPLGGDYAQRWEVATRAQMNLAGQRRDEAEAAIHSMVNHLCQLAQSASWFSEAGLAGDAVGETLEHVAYGRDVASAEAQHAWARYWDMHGQQPPAFSALSSAKESWLAAWQRWLEHRPPTG